MTDREYSLWEKVLLAACSSGKHSWEADRYANDAVLALRKFERQEAEDRLRRDFPHTLVSNPAGVNEAAAEIERGAK